MLVEQQVIHNHINFETIVVDKRNEMPLLTNLEFSIDLSRKDIGQYIKHFFIEYDPSYLEWPLELHILSYLITNKLTGPTHSISSYNIDKYLKNYNIFKNAFLKIWRKKDKIYQISFTNNDLYPAFLNPK